MTLPTLKDGLHELSDQFWSSLNFHNATEDTDGKHIAMKAPKNAGSVYQKYKSFFSIFLLGVVDIDYKFIWVDWWINGSTSDCALFKNSNLKVALKNGNLG